MFYVYKITNDINKKVYIGKTNDLTRRYKEHIRLATSAKRTSQDCIKFYRSIRKYGIINFSNPEILGTYATEEEAFNAEKIFIIQYDSFKNGLNACHGGQGIFGSGENSVFAIHKESILRKRSEKKNSLEKIEARFLSYVNKTDNCWIWTGGRVDEYGGFRFKSKQIRAHQASWILTNGSIPDGYLVSHLCENFLCVRPDHLVLRTRNELNSIVNSKSERQGSNNSQSKLTEEDVRSIKIEFETSKVTKTSLARKYDVSHTTISRILSGKKWKSVI